jgi:putative oxygen-independent coproporphyrinogen III oxidase
MRQRRETPQSVYIHIPFCTNKCHYCDFNSYVLKGQPVDAYLDALEREMEATIASVPPQVIQTIFVGGGAPTVLTPPQMIRLLQMIQSFFPERAEHYEFTVEANPGTTNEELLHVMRAGGVNRLSLGVQSFEPKHLSAIGRIHSVEDVERSIEQARSANFSNLSIDLMFGLPNQSLAELNHSLHRALALQLPHYSIYGLKIEEHTLFHTLYERGELPLPTEEVEVEMFQSIMEQMSIAGLRQYEISNFAKEGLESKHNSVYWRNYSYYGLGAGAHGYVSGIRHLNHKGIQAYIDATVNGLPQFERFEVTEAVAMEDFMMVGLRMLSGVERREFALQFDASLEDTFGHIIHRLMRDGMIVTTEHGYRLSEQGILLGNEVFASFVQAIEL